MTKILVAEDDKFLSNAYRVKLSKAGYDVKVVSDGQEALSAFDSFSPDIFLLDLVMPRIDGFVVLEKLKAEGKIGKVPILVASNLGQKEDVDRAKSLGASGYVIKSDLSMKDLLARLKSLLPKNPPAPEATPEKAG